MKKARFTDEQIVAALRDAEATTISEAARKHQVSEGLLHRWRKHAGMETSHVRELKRLQDEDARLQSLLAERDLEAEVMKQIQAKSSLMEARVVIEKWPRHYNAHRPHSSQNYNDVRFGKQD